MSGIQKAFFIIGVVFSIFITFTVCFILLYDYIATTIATISFTKFWWKEVKTKPINIKPFLKGFKSVWLDEFKSPSHEVTFHNGKRWKSPIFRKD